MVEFNQEVFLMVFTYRTNTISGGIDLPIDVYAKEHHYSCVRVVEDLQNGVIEVFLPKQKTITASQIKSYEGKHCKVFKAFVDIVSSIDGDNKILFQSLRSLGNDPDEARVLYTYMVRKRINAEFISSSLANTEKFQYILKCVPEATEELMVTMFKDLYKMELLQEPRKLSAIEDDITLKQLSRNEKFKPQKH